MNQSDQSAAWGDFDLDGWQDLLVSNADYPPETQLRLFRQKSKRVFEDVTSLLDTAVINPKGGIFVDLDGDGDLDVVAASSTTRGNREAFSRVFLNQTIDRLARRGGDLDWIEVRLSSTAPAVAEYPVGASVRLISGSRRTQKELGRRELASGYSADHQLSEVLHFGIPTAARGSALSLDVRWPNGVTKRYPATARQLNRIDFGTTAGTRR